MIINIARKSLTIVYIISQGITTFVFWTLDDISKIYKRIVSNISDVISENEEIKYELSMRELKILGTILSRNIFKKDLLPEDLDLFDKFILEYLRLKKDFCTTEYLTLCEGGIYDDYDDYDVQATESIVMDNHLLN